MAESKDAAMDELDAALNAMGPDEFAKLMIRARKERKQAEGDSLLLANRLEHLRKEQAKAQKRVEETKKRAAEISGMKKRNTDNQSVKSASSHSAQRRRHVEMMKMAEQKAAMKQRKADRRKKKDAERTAEVARRGKEKERLKKEKEARQRAELEKKRAQKEKVRLARLAAKRKKEARERERLEKQKAEYRRRIREEKQVKEAFMKEVLAMEEEELMWIAKLKQTQAEQRKAYETLETALEERNAGGD